MTQMEIRSVEIRSVDEEKRTVSGLAVPYKRSVNVGGYNESFEPGAIEDVSDTKLFWNHQEPIGRVVRGEDTDEGYLIEAVISKTSRGEEAYTLVKDGVINKFSVGFTPVEHRMDGEDVVRTKVNLMEVSLVPFPAYKDAQVLSVRELAETADRNSANTINEMEVIQLDNENKNAPESAELREAVEVLERKVNALGMDRNDEVVVPQFRSFGEYAKAYAEGDEKAVAFYRAYTGGTSADSVLKNSWVGDSVRLLEAKRKTINAFNKVTLPNEGNFVEYGVLDANTLDVDEQVNEGDELAFGKISVTSATAPVKTYGGYTSLTRQEIERGSVNIIDLSFKGMVKEYARATELVVRNTLTGLTVATNGIQAATLASDDASGWIGFVVDSVAALEDEDLVADFILVSDDVYKRLATLEGADGRPLLSFGAGVNTIGSANAGSLTANLLGITVLRDSALAANTCYVAAKDAIKVFESAGAPFKLGPEEDVSNLTRDYSVYGYLAVAVEMPQGIVLGDVDLVA